MIYLPVCMFVTYIMDDDTVLAFCICVCMYVCMYVHTYVCMYVCMYVCIYMYGCFGVMSVHGMVRYVFPLSLTHSLTHSLTI